MPQQLTLKQIRYFLAAAQTGQFSTAAAKVHVTQTAITTAMRELEAVLGTPLFERRHAAGVALTAEGHRFLHHAHNIVAAINEAARTGDVLSRNVRGRVKLAATHAILGHYILPALSRFRQGFSGVDVTVEELARPQIERELARQRIDVGAVWITNVEDLVRLETYPLTRSRRQLWLSSNHRLLSKRGIYLHDVAEEPYVLYAVDEVERNTRAFWQKSRLSPNVVLKTTSLEAVRSMVALGQAVTILSDVAYRPWSSEGLRIEARPLQNGLPPVEIGLVWLRNRDLPPAAKTFCEFMRLTYSGPGLGIKVI